jgi:thioredoxin 1
VVRPVRVLTPVLDRIAGRYTGRVRFFQADVDAEPDLAERFSVSSVPTLAFFQNGRLVDRHEGLIDPRLLLLKLDHLAGSAPATL